MKIIDTDNMFENSEVDVEDGADIPFDLDHITHIEIEE
jgi:hypothetical protein